jgi:leucyl aminopeptidase
MKIRCIAPKDTIPKIDLVAGFAFSGNRVPDLGKGLKNAVQKAKKTGDLAHGFRKASLFHPELRGGGPKRLLFVGGGKRSDLDSERLRRMAAVVQAQAEEAGASRFQLVVHADDHGDVDAFHAGRAIAEGIVMGAYRYEPPRKEAPKARKGQNAEISYRGEESAAFEAGVALGTTLAEAVNFARDVENKPGNLMTPTDMANEARGLAGAKVKVKVLEEKDMERLGMNALLGVSRGSRQPAKLILLDYAPKGAETTVCVVGKGLTFDAGGISIKPSARMDEMRYDMCGGGAVLGFFHGIANGSLDGLERPVRVVGVIPSSENLPDGNAQKPGDVVRAMNGTTIEVLNTDAEGRLILADALHYAITTYEPDHCVDLATLTGAVIVALGHEVAAVMGNDDELIDELIDAGKDADDPLWELPLWSTHREQCKSKFADIANINGAGHGNGSINGGAFLSYFVGKTSWAHIDIAGTAWGQKPKDHYKSGATGTGVRMLTSWVRRLGTEGDAGADAHGYVDDEDVEE